MVRRKLPGVKSLSFRKIKKDVDVKDRQLSSPATPNTFQFYAVKKKNQPTVQTKYFIEQNHFSEEDQLSSDDTSVRDWTSMELNPTDQPIRKPSCAQRCCSPIDFWALIAALLCVSGGIIFTIFHHRVLDTTLQVLNEVMHVHFNWLQLLQTLMTAMGCILTALSLLVFCASFISKPSSLISDPPPSRWPTSVFMVLIYPAIVLWLLMMSICIALWLLSDILQGVCLTEEIAPLWQNSSSPPISGDCQTVSQGIDCVNCIDLYQFHFLFPENTRKEDTWLCGTEIFKFCGSDLPTIVTNWLISLVGSVLALVGVCIHMMDLSFNRTDLSVRKHNLEYLVWLRTHPEKPRPISDSNRNGRRIRYTKANARDREETNIS